MALSYYTNWETEMNFPAQAETELLQELFNDNFGFFPETSCDVNIDHLFEPNNDILYDYAAENCTPLLPSYPPPPTDYNFNTPLVEFDPFHIQKRQKLYDYDLNSVFPEVLLPDFLTAPPIYNGGSCETATKAPGGGLSSQSIAARQRRRKITEKTQELSKLVPGGQKMNTAEMLQSAHKYIKFLQAQVGILDFMGSSSTYDHHHQEELQDLLGSTLIQGKLYSTEKCLVPGKFVQELATDHPGFDSKPELLNEVRELWTSKPVE